MSASTETPTASPEAPSPSGRGRQLVPWLVAVAAVALAVFSTVQWRTLAAEQAAREEVETAAGTFLVELTTWDASDGLADTRDRLTELGTGAFVAEVDELFGAELGEELRELSARSEGEVQDVFVQSIDGDRAVVFGVVHQTQTTDVTPRDTITRSARVVLERVDGDWLVSRVEMVDPGQNELGDVTAPTGEDSP